MPNLVQQLRQRLGEPREGACVSATALSTYMSMHSRTATRSDTWTRSGIAVRVGSGKGPRATLEASSSTEAPHADIEIDLDFTAGGLPACPCAGVG